ncbi:hypothetical protein TARUN_572 [Trichoderma arundinaceum]|uniref:Uncharacterized protein n=1 Tax=Trichoderma arundinaceum TaxID=490622 RepID=A0A395NZY8_TRIAR|nr:hypothetical protein TARUN_572 [Trichoderma arundinaceum]
MVSLHATPSIPTVPGPPERVDRGLPARAHRVPFATPYDEKAERQSTPRRTRTFHMQNRYRTDYNISSISSDLSGPRPRPYPCSRATCPTSVGRTVPTRAEIVGPA